MFRVLRIKRSAFNKWRQRGDSKRVLQDRELGVLIDKIFTQHKRRYGAKRIRLTLRDHDIYVSKKRVARLMKEHGLKSKHRRKYVVTTDSKHSDAVAENLLDQDFTATAPNKKWAGDITYIDTKEGWLYLAVVMDLYSRLIIGFAMSDTIDNTLVRAAMLMALRQRKPMPGLIMHTDKGSQYTAHKTQQLLDAWTVAPSMSGTGNCYDNAVSETFFATLKKELVHHERYVTRQEARASIFEYIVSYYNRTRLHSTIGYRTPFEFDQHYIINKLTADRSTVNNATFASANL